MPFKLIDLRSLYLETAPTSKMPVSLEDIELPILDADRIIFNSEKVITKAEKTTVSIMGLPRSGIKGKDQVTRCRGDLACYPKNARKQIKRTFRQKREEASILMPGALDFLDNLYKKGMKTVILTDSTDHDIEARVKTAGVGKYVKSIYGSRKGVSKLDNYNRIQEKEKVTGEKIFFLSDNADEVYDLRIAGCGLPVVGLPQEGMVGKYEMADVIRRLRGRNAEGNIFYTNGFNDLNKMFGRPKINYDVLTESPNPPKIEIPEEFIIEDASIPQNYGEIPKKPFQKNIDPRKLLEE